MNIFFSKNIINEFTSAHNFLATAVASFNHDVRYYSGTGGKVFFYGEEGIQSTTEEIHRSIRRSFILYDNMQYDTCDIRNVITFGESGKYRTYPVNYEFSHIGRIPSTVSFGCIRNSTDMDKYTNALLSIDGKIILANIGEKKYISDMKTSLIDAGKTVSVSENQSMAMLMTYLRTCQILVHFGAGIGMLHAYASLFAIHDKAKYITESQIVDPTNLHIFMKSEGI